MMQPSYAKMNNKVRSDVFDVRFLRRRGVDICSLNPNFSFDDEKD